MKISVIVPVYNGEKYICDCLDSLKRQTYPNMEIIIVNDGSTDKTKEKIMEYIKHNIDISIKLISKKNEGLPQARKTGVENSTGDYIGFLDVDDWVEFDEYYEMMDVAIREAADMVCCGYQLDYGTKQLKVKQNLDFKKVYSGLEAFDYMHKRIAIYPYAWNKIYKRELLEHIKYPTGNFVGEDYAIQVQVLPKAKRVCIVPGCKHHYMQVENSMCRGGYNANYILAYKNYEYNRKLFCRQYPEYAVDINNYMLTEYMAMIVAMGKNNTYNMEMAINIQKFVRKHMVHFLMAKEVPIIMKGSAIAVALNYKILNLVYNVIAKQSK